MYAWRICGGVYALLVCVGVYMRDFYVMCVYVWLVDDVGLCVACLCFVLLCTCMSISSFDCGTVLIIEDCGARRAVLSNNGNMSNNGSMCTLTLTVNDKRALCMTTCQYCVQD